MGPFPGNGEPFFELSESGKATPPTQKKNQSACQHSQPAQTAIMSGKAGHPAYFDPQSEKAYMKQPTVFKNKKSLIKKGTLAPR